MWAPKRIMTFKYEVIMPCSKLPNVCELGRGGAGDGGYRRHLHLVSVQAQPKELMEKNQAVSTGPGSGRPEPSAAV